MTPVVLSRRALALLTLLGAGVLIAVFALPSASQAANVPCAAYTESLPIPQGYGAAYNLFTDARGLLLQGKCFEKKVRVTAGDSAAASTTYVYSTAYWWDGEKWRPFTFTGTAAGSQWVAGEAEAEIAMPSSFSNLYVAAYVCQLQNGSWKCGCRNQSCNQNYWQLQRFPNYFAYNGAGGGEVVGDDDTGDDDAGGDDTGGDDTGDDDTGGTGTGGDSVAVGNWPSSFDNDLPWGGVMYGNPVAGDNPGFIGKYGYQASYRFRAYHTGTVKKINVNNRTYNIVDGKKYKDGAECDKWIAGAYHTGDGGRILVEIRTDDGTGKPSNTVLARATEEYRPVPNNAPLICTGSNGMKHYASRSGMNHTKTVKLDRTVKITAGAVYHIVLNQTQPSTGRIAADGMLIFNRPNLHGGPFFGNVWTILQRDSASQAWKDRSDERDVTLMPKFALFYDDGTIAGPNYNPIGVLGTVLGKSIYVGGARRIRQVFTVHDQDFTITGVWVRAGKIRETNDPLKVEVKRNTTVIASGTIPASAYRVSTSNMRDGVADWAYVRFNDPVVIRKGTKYSLEISASSGPYAVLFNAEGGEDYGKFGNWSGGEDRAEYSTNGGNKWNTIDYGNYGNDKVLDLSAAFTVLGMPERL